MLIEFDNLLVKSRKQGDIPDEDDGDEDFDGCKSIPIQAKLKTLVEIKNDIIGSIDQKSAYFNNGLLETILQLLSKNEQEDSSVLTEALTVLNSFIYDLPESKTFFTFHQETLL